VKVVADTKIDRLLRWQAGETPGPWQVTLFPTNRCNLRCKICWQRGATDLDRTNETPDDRLLELVDECAEMGVREWCIIGGGEPMLRAELILNLCRKIREYGVNGALQTNGTLLTPAHIEQLIDMGWGRINVSLDGPTRAINDDIRSEGSFEKATANIKLIAELKRKLQVGNPIVSLYTVITSTNYDKIGQMVDLAHDLECEPGGIHITTMVVHSDAGKPFQLNEAQKAELPSHIYSALERAQKYNMENNFAICLQEEVLADPNAMHEAIGKLRGKGLVRSMCYEPWLSVAITAEGHVGPCCAFWDPRSDSIRDMSFRDVWLGPYLDEVRHRLLTGRPPGYCSRCPSTLFSQSRGLREELRWKQSSVAGRAATLGLKAASSMRRYGLRRAIRRGREWVQIRMSK